ncbi:MAG: cupin domain-containing protein [Nocardioides sp.]|uniref:cupin domain-containing protein n=1 Tax=Nocardioides sp. TaxID=35761 RepID=UPI003F081820
MELLDASVQPAVADLPGETVLAGAPRAGAVPLTTLGDLEVGVWEMTPGTATDVEVDEVFVVLVGSATVSVEGGPTIDLSPGSLVRLHAGDRTTWTVHAALRKLYVG